MRAAIAVGVNPWSASATRQASKSVTCSGVGRRRAASQNASSPKPTVPIRSWICSSNSVIVVRVDRPSDDG
jgi:hypothetical protein